MYGGQRVSHLEFHDNVSLYEQIDSERGFHVHVAVVDRHRHLPLHAQPVMPELGRKAGLVGGFQQARTQMPMHRDRTPDNCSRERVDVSIAPSIR